MSFTRSQRWNFIVLMALINAVQIVYGIEQKFSIVGPIKDIQQNKLIVFAPGNRNGSGNDQIITVSVKENAVIARLWIPSKISDPTKPLSMLKESILIEDLKVGDDIVAVSSTDISGLTAFQAISIEVNGVYQGVKIFINIPSKSSEYKIYDSKIAIGGQVGDGSAIELNRIHLENLSNSFSVVDSISGFKSDFTIENIPLSVGENHIVVTAFDEAGNNDSDQTVIISTKIELIRPNGGETLMKGTDYSITWNDQKINGEIQIVLFKSGYQILEIVASTPNTGSYTFNPPLSLPDGNDYKIGIFEINGNASGCSEMNISIQSPPKINIIEPNGGEVWHKGNQYTITWTGKNNSGNVKIQIVKGNHSPENAFFDIVDSTINMGRYTFIIPNELPDGNNYKITITDIKDENNHDISDDFISIGNKGSTWSLQNGFLGNYLNSVFFTDTLNGWIVGIAGLILHTADGGITWEHQISGTNDFLGSIVFKNKDNGWAVGGGTILHTSDGGKKWNIQITNNNAWLESVSFLNLHTGWVVGTSGTILNTSDGGSNWCVQKIGDVWLKSIYFRDLKHGWAVGSAGSILRTFDAGKTWIPQISGTQEDLYSVFFNDTSNGWAVGSSGTIIHTNNGGNTWFPQESNTQNWLNCVHFTNIDAGWVVGESGTLISTVNGGKSWIQREIGIINNLKKIYLIEDNRGWIVGDETVIKYDYKNEIQNNVDYQNNINFIVNQNYPNPFNSSTCISYFLPISARVNISVYDCAGNTIIQLLHEQYKESGLNKINWDGTDENGFRIPSGVYMYLIEYQNMRISNKMILVK